MDFYKNTAYKDWHDFWRLRLKHSLSASNFKAKIALVYKWKALSCTYVKKCSDWITYMYISDRVFIAHKCQIMHAFLSSAIFFQNNLDFFRNTIKVSTVWLQIKPDILSCLIWVQLICKGYQRPTLVSRQIYAITAKISLAGPNMTMVLKRLIIFASQGY